MISPATSKLEVEASRVLVREGLGWGAAGRDGGRGAGMRCGLWDAPSYTAVENPCMGGLRLTATTL